MAPGEFKAISTTDLMIILIAKGRSSRNLVIRYPAYNNVQQTKNLSIQEMKAVDTEMRTRIMVRMPDRGGEKEDRRMSPESSDGIYFTASVEAQFRLIAQNQKIK